MNFSPQLVFEISNQTIRRIDEFDVVGDSQNYLHAQFNFITDEWNGLVKTALFRRGTNGNVYEVILENDQCLVPHEVLSGNDRFVYVSVFAGELITVNAEKFYVESSGYWNDAESSVDPTPSVYQQIMDRLADVEDIVVESAESASQSATSASESATIAQESAESAHNDAVTASEMAQESAESAESAYNSALLAEEKANNANLSANDADNFAKNAKSWAVGGTNTRTGEDTDNAKYYAERAKSFSESLDWEKVNNKPDTLEGYGVQEVPVSMLSGVIGIENIPSSVTERMCIVSNDTARFALTTNEVQNGDVVKVESSSLMYYVKDDTKLDSEDGYEIFKAGSASTVPFSGITDKPTTLSGYGITNAYTKNEVNNLLDDKVTVVDGKGLSTNDYTNDEKAKLEGIESGAEANVNPDWNATSGDAQIFNKPSTLEGYGVQSVPVSMLDGIIGIEHIPPAALERMVSVPTETAKYLLSKTNVQNGDTVKVIATNKMYLVINDDNLDNENGYMEYSSGTASSVPWSGVTGKPTSISGYGITDAYSKDKVDDYLDEKVDKVSGKGLSTNDYTDSEKEKLSGIEDGANVNIKSDWNAVSGDAQILNKPTTLVGYGVQSVPVSMLEGVINLSNLPHGALERLVTVADISAMYALTTSNVQNGDVVKVESTGEMYFVVDDAHLDSAIGYRVFTASTATSVPWSGVTGKPSSLVGYGINDAYSQTEVDDLLSGKVDKVNGKCLSTEDYTTQEKNKLSGIANGADVANPNIAQIETSPTTHAYEAGEYLVYNGILYKAKTDISIGDTLTVGTNIESTTVSEAMSSIQPELEFDDTPTEGSTNPVTSDGIYEALQGVGHSEEMTFAQYNALTDAQKNDGTERYITDVDNIPYAEGVSF